VRYASASQLFRLRLSYKFGQNAEFAAPHRLTSASSRERAPHASVQNWTESAGNLRNKAVAYKRNAGSSIATARRFGLSGLEAD